MTLDLTKYVVGVDVWEGDDDPDWNTLVCNDVKFVFIRMNVSDGSLTLDKQFHNWPQAQGLARAAYVVVSPFISRQAYVSWIMSNLPSDCKVVALDIEIQGSTMADYSKLVNGILSDLQNRGLHVLVYSGAWFFGYLAPWPSSYDQWWARYPSVLYPTEYEHLTWPQMRTKLSNLTSFSPLGNYTFQPGHIAIWQCTSKYILPGGPVNWPIDVNLMPLEDFERIFGERVPTIEERVTKLEKQVKELLQAAGLPANIV